MLRTLVFGLLPLLATIWVITHLGIVEKYVSLIFPYGVPRSNLGFDARLHPELHAQRDVATIELDWVIRRELRSPDGIQKFIYTVNGLFPGPTIEARSGDRLVLRVHNELVEETTAIHFHGIRQIGSNSMDGTPGVTQCAIKPKRNFVYNFTISESQTGTYWWHSHSQSQRADGLFGALIVHEHIKDQRNFDHIKEDLRIRDAENEKLLNIGSFSERVALVGDWYHGSASEMLKWYRSKKSYGFEPTPESALFNGFNLFNCSRASPYVNCDDSRERKPSLSLDLSLKTRLRLINTGSLAELEISLDSHSLIVIEADGSPVVPRKVESVTISPGQRYSVILEPQSPLKPRNGDSFWLRLRMSKECFQMANPALDLEQFFLIHYGDSPRNSNIVPPTPLEGPFGMGDFEPLSLIPLHRTLLPKVDQQLLININSVKLDRFGGIPFGFVNRTSWIPDENEPLLLRQVDINGETSWGNDQLVVTTDRGSPSVVELIINNLDEGPHPFHLHGHHFYPLHVHKSTYGWGRYNYSSPPVIPAEAPVLRDTLVVPRRGHAVIRFLADAPGMWLFHCHVLVHLRTGMAMIFNVRPEFISPFERQIVSESCSTID